MVADFTGFRKFLLALMFFPVLFAIPAVPALGQDPGKDQGGDKTGMEALDQGGKAQEKVEDTSVYEEQPVVQAQDASISISAFWSGAYAFLSNGTMDFDGNTDLDHDGTDDTEMQYEADGAWELAYLRGGVRLEVGKKTAKFRLDLFYQRILARFESDGKTSIDYYNSGSGNWTAANSTAYTAYHLQGGGITVGLDLFFAARTAIGANGVSRFAVGPTLGFGIHLSAGHDSDEGFNAGYVALDVDLGVKVRVLNLLEFFAEIGLYGGAMIGIGDEVNMAVAPGICWRAALGFGFCF